ncbi:hypothetical protein K2173_019211 [Erythroxylum novogranatense]|uniref:Glycosyltransferase n=1 Tax=Erythroxylum novogranatense TaxID=1862640 RepID=A0AAV8ST52_9ROSI|nr:hypothetical protein K2173_019211 [Erythroxylum novogranatense]
MADRQQNPHAVMFPVPLQGHIIPFVHLALKLASEGFTITFVVTQAIHHKMTQARPITVEEEDMFTAARKSGLDIRYKTVGDGFPLGFDRDQNLEQYLEGFLHVFSAHVDDLLGQMVGTASPTMTCLISDTFHPWPSTLARKYNLVNVSFWTEPALAFSLYYHLDLLRINGHYDCHDKREDTIDYVPGVGGLEPKDLTSYLQETNTSTAMHRIVQASFKDVKKADIVICNTVQEMESKAILALQERQSFYAIGPLLPSGLAKSIVSPSFWMESDCKGWLDTNPSGTVLYVSFGSFAECNEEAVVEIAYGLLLSKVRFIWVLRPNTEKASLGNFLPLGFGDQIKEQGLVVPWCNQIAAISHPSVGGFLTHCGWNSVLESIWHCLPMLCFPLFTDQFTNRKLVVDDWRIGLNLCDRKPITRYEIAEKINNLMGGKISIELGKKIKELKGTMEHALSSTGSSENNFNQLIHDVKVKTLELGV